MSVKGDILRAAAGVLRALPGPGGRPLAVAVRKRLQHDKGYEGKRTLVLVPDGERTLFLRFGNRKAVGYPVWLVFLQDRGLREDEIDWEGDARDAAARALHKPALPGVPAVWDVKFENDPPFSPDAWRPFFDASAQRFMFVTDEARSA